MKDERLTKDEVAPEASFREGTVDSSAVQGPAPILVRKMSKAQLQDVSPEDQALFLSIAHIANEMNALLRAVVWSSGFNSPVQAKVDGQRTLSLMFLELLAGKLHEANEVIEGPCFGTALGKTYAARLTPNGQRAREVVKRYFKHECNARKIRNIFAFHYSEEMRGKLVQVLPSVTENLVVYMQLHGNSNNLYYFAEVVAAEALFQAIGIPNCTSALNDLFKELIEVARNFAILFDDLMGSFLETLGQDAWEAAAEPVSFDELPSFDDLQIPWFTFGSVHNH